MALLTRRQKDFLEQCATSHAVAEEAAAAAEDYIREVLMTDTSYDLHAVQGRAKAVESARHKLLTKHYGNPAQQMTDQIGVRVITLYGAQVDPIAERLKRSLVIDEKNSVDKRRNLGESEFGYRSVHLVARLRPSAARVGKRRLLRDRWFEVQVRSVLDHAWAEVEHEIVYKSAIDYPKDVRRDFAAIAGTLEFVEREFLRLRERKMALIREYVERLQQGKDRDEQLDSARLAAVLQYRLPTGRSWFATDGAALVDAIPPPVCLSALAAVDITTARQFLAIARKKGFESRLGDYAASQGIAENETSHPAVVAVMVGYVNRDAFDVYFADLAATPAFAQLFRS